MSEGNTQQQPQQEQQDSKTVEQYFNDIAAYLEADVTKPVKLTRVGLTELLGEFQKEKEEQVKQEVSAELKKVIQAWQDMNKAEQEFKGKVGAIKKGLKENLKNIKKKIDDNKAAQEAEVIGLVALSKETA